MKTINIEEINDVLYFSSLPQAVKVGLAQLCRTVAAQQAEIDALKCQVARLVEETCAKEKKMKCPKCGSENGE